MRTFAAGKAIHILYSVEFSQCTISELYYDRYDVYDVYIVVHSSNVCPLVATKAFDITITTMMSYFN